ncbi:transglycosylase domain-containing protein [Bartonella sp. DGB1]|uniref:transglycosylase domain-containing protein n=1 Tax=Bartonella sp. DGB1 TaxID=3239807 RepID=UPI0035239E85
MLFFEKITPRGITKSILTLLSNLLNLLIVGLFIFLAFAFSAFNILKNPLNSDKEISARFLDIHGNYIGQRGKNWGKDITIDELPDYFIKAILATEDRRFFYHWGIDIIGILRAMVQNSKAENVVQGGSTLTQQLAKNLYLSNKRTISRKINEAFIALWLEANLSKKEIITKYLNNVYMGAGAYGVQNAAHVYFNKDVRYISLSEAAMLAGLFKAPSNYAPNRHLQTARQRANTVLNNLVDKGFMSESEVMFAKQNPADFKPNIKQKTPGYFLDWAYNELKKIYNENPFNEKHVIVYTTFNPMIQSVAEDSVEKILKEYGKGYKIGQAAATVIINREGAVNAIVGGKDYEISQFNRATVAQRQAGSSFKVYSYTTLFERTNLTLQSYVTDEPFSWGGWSPRNISRRYYGRISIADAIAYSYNTIPPKLIYQYFRSTAPVIETAKALGVTSKLDTNRAMILGTSGMTVFEQTVAYHTLANGGKAGTIHGIKMIKTEENEKYYG